MTPGCASSAGEMSVAGGTMCSTSPSPQIAPMFKATRNPSSENWRRSREGPRTVNFPAETDGAISDRFGHQQAGCSGHDSEIGAGRRASGETSLEPNPNGWRKLNEYGNTESSGGKKAGESNCIGPVLERR